MGADDYDPPSSSFRGGIKTNDPVRARAKVFGWGRVLEETKIAKDLQSDRIHK